MERERIAVVPAGSFGTAMGIVAARNGHDVALFVPREKTLRRIIDTGQNPKLDGIDLPSSMMVTGDIGEATEGRSMIVFAAPSHIVPRFAELLAGVVDDASIQILSLTKGLHVNSSYEVRSTTRILNSLMPQVQTAAESGPNFARDVAMGEEKVLTVIASENDSRFHHADTFTTDMFEVEVSDDEIGVQVAGATKNVYAVAIGMCKGAGVSDDEIKRLVAHGPLEMARLGSVVGAKEETFYGTAGKGDLEITCTPGSRNYRAGLRLGRRELTADELMKETIAKNEVIEGMHASYAVKLIAEQHHLDLPVLNAMAAVVHDRMDISEAVNKMREV